MREYLEFEEWTFDSIGRFIEDAVNQDNISLLYLLGKAAAYVDAGFSFGELSESEAWELHIRIGDFGCSPCAQLLLAVKGGAERKAKKFLRLFGT